MCSKTEHIFCSTYTTFSRLSNAHAWCKALFLEWVLPLSFRLTFNFLKSRRNYEGLKCRHANDDTTVSRHRGRMRFLFAQVSWFYRHSNSNFDPPTRPHGQKSEKSACEDLSCLNLLNSCYTSCWNASIALQCSVLTVFGSSIHLALSNETWQWSRVPELFVLSFLLLWPKKRMPLTNPCAHTPLIMTI